MPIVSKAQNAAMHAAQQGRSTLGIPPKVGAEFVSKSKDIDVANLPERVNKKVPSAMAQRGFANGMIGPSQMAKLYG